MSALTICGSTPTANAARDACNFASMALIPTRSPAMLICASEFTADAARKVPAATSVRCGVASASRASVRNAGLHIDA